MISKLFIKYKVRFNQMPLSILRNQKGVTAVLVAIVAAMLLGFTALAIDVGYMYSTRNELQNVSDAAALAGAGELGRFYLGLGSVAEQQDVKIIDCEGPIGTAVQDTAIKNEAAGVSISIDPDEIFIGTWNWGTSYLNIGEEPPDAVRVIARRATTINSPVATFFGKIFSFFGGSADTFEASAVATAALSAPASVGEGELITPVGISYNFFRNPGDPCSKIIEFSPTSDSCAGWHNFFDAINANDLSNKLISFIEAYDYNGEIDGVLYEGNLEGQKWLLDHFVISKDVIPEVTDDTYDTTIFEFQGGAIAALFLGGYYKEWLDGDNPHDPDDPDNLDPDPVGNAAKPAPFFTLFDFFRFRDNDTVYDDDGEIVLIETCHGSYHPDDVWTATVPVYLEEGDSLDSPDPAAEEEIPCTNPNTAIPIVGYAEIQIITPNPPPDNNIVACVDCEFNVIEGRGGGGNFGGVKGHIPNLVQ